MQSLDMLTTFQLETAAADLRNAGLVVKHAGHFRGGAVDYKTGSVCAAGAIDVSTFRSLRYMNLIKRHVIGGDLCDNYRAENAYTVFANFIPTGLCDKCDYETPCGTCGESFGMCCTKGDATAWERVVHYNDAHCIGGELLVNMLGHAADRAAIEAADRRKLLTGTRLVDAVA